MFVDFDPELNPDFACLFSLFQQMVDEATDIVSVLPVCVRSTDSVVPEQTERHTYLDSQYKNTPVNNGSMVFVTFNKGCNNLRNSIIWLLAGSESLRFNVQRGAALSVPAGKTMIFQVNRTDPENLFLVPLGVISNV